MKYKKIIIAIDGYSSTGKSTMAKRLAAEIGYRYIDSGAMYRVVTLCALRNNLIDADGTIDINALNRLLDVIKIDFVVTPNGQRTYLDGEDVEQEIRSMTVADNVSAIAAIPSVRKVLTRLQQDMGRDKGIVMDGRDIGTTVFPDAEMKLFVTATPQTRARRRYKELLEKGMKATLEEVMENILRRDKMDENRKESPLRKADDAIMIDNSLLTLDQQHRHVLNLFHEIARTNDDC
ncbi:MAG: (d)CMP kinase [Paramuribaculum sp.]|nr:(d)CMP kinase [Paramuribaculum sp.]